MIDGLIMFKRKPAWSSHCTEIGCKVFGDLTDQHGGVVVVGECSMSGVPGFCPGR